jgi:hypothetical protein
VKLLTIVAFISLFFSNLFSAPLDDKRIEVSKISNDRYKMKIYYNYENPYQTEMVLMGRMAYVGAKIPIPERFNVLKMRTEVKYTPSYVLYHARSSISINANKLVIRQFGLNEQRFKDSGKITISADIPTKDLEDYNDIGVKIIQHYSSGVAKDDVEDTSAPELWTQVDLQNSFVEIEFQLKPFEEKLSSISKFMFDNKSIFKDSINFVFPKTPTDDDFYNYGFMANLIGTILQYRDIDFSVSTSISDNRNNIIILPRKELKEKLEPYKNMIEGLEEKISGNINMVKNPKRDDKGFLIITGDSDEDIKSSLYRMVNRDILLLEEQNIKVFKTEIPEKAKPYSTPGFISTGDKVYFSDLGYKTRTFFGEESAPLYLNFKLYPTVKYDVADSIRSVLNIISGGIIRNDSATNIFVNEVLAFQIRTLSTNDEDRVAKTASQRFELGDKNLIPAKLLRKGKNTLKVQFALVPLSGPQLIRFNNDILKLTLRDDSHIIFPKAKTEIELPNLKYVSELAFPYSIYADLQNTGILVTDFDSRTISSAMYVAFHLGKLMNYPAYRLTITPDINKMLDKDIITIGNQVERYSLLYKNAPIQFTKDGVVKEVALDSKFVEESGARVKQHTATTKIVESINFKDYIIVQQYQSPFNPRRTVLELSSNDAGTLLDGVRNGFSALHLGKFDGDVWLYNIKTDESYSFRLKETYILNEIVEGYSKKSNVITVDDF